MKSEDERRDLLDRAQQINELVATPGWALLVDFVNATRIKKQQAIIAGLDHDQYIKEVEWLKGADYVLRANEYLNAMVASDTLEHAELTSA